nr:hypothetical protein [Anaerolineae bacterium]
MLKIIRRLTVIGAFVVMLSYMLKWVEVQTAQIVTGIRPISILILGVTLLILSFFPTKGHWRGASKVMLVAGSLAAIVVSLWALTEAILQKSLLPYNQLGPGPVVALIGTVMFVIGSLGHLQKTTEDERYHEEPTYRVVGLEDQTDLDSQDLNGMSRNFVEGEG